MMPDSNYKELVKQGHENKENAFRDAHIANILSGINNNSGKVYEIAPGIAALEKNYIKSPDNVPLGATTESENQKTSNDLHQEVDTPAGEFGQEKGEDNDYSYGLGQ